MNHRPEMAHLVCGGLEGEAKAYPPGASTVHVVGLGTEAALYTCINVDERFLEHSRCLYRLDGEISHFQFGPEGVLQPDLFLATGQELGAETETFVETYHALYLAAATDHFNGGNRVGGRHLLDFE